MNFDVKERKAYLQELVDGVLKEAKKQGASLAEVSAYLNVGLTTTVRLGHIDIIEHTNANGISINVYFGKHKGNASTADFSIQAIYEAVTAACNIARYTAEDDCAGLVAPDLLIKDKDVLDLDLYHPWLVEPKEMIQVANQCEEAAFSYNKYITNSEGATVNANNSIGIYGNSYGFNNGYPNTIYSINCSVIAKDANGMQRDYWWKSSRVPKDIVVSNEHVGRRAASRAIARLAARKLKTRNAPVLFTPEMAASLIHSFINAISGSTLYRESSFLLNAINTRIFPDWVRIEENPHILQGLSSAPFDAEGVSTNKRLLIKEGILKGYILDSYSACKLKMTPTGNAGGVHNLNVQLGKLDYNALICEMHKGLIVSEMMGQNINLVTGDYSRGASGFWVNNGQIQYPVEEITIAGNLKQIFSDLVAIGNDDDYPGSICTGSWLINNMMIAGN